MLLVRPPRLLLLGIACAAFAASSVRAPAQSEKKPYLSIRLMNLNTYGDTITRWLEPGAANFGQINWTNHNLCRYDFSPGPKPPEFLESVEKSRAALKAKADQTHRLGMLCYLNEYELNYPAFMKREDLLPAPAREKFMEDKLYEILTQCPWLEGYMITPTESKLGAANPVELKAVVMGAYKGLKRAEKELGKKRYLFVRSWLSAAASLARVREYFPITTDPEIAKDIIVVSKDGLGDFVMRRPLNPLFGAVQPHAICAEFDVSVSEYRSLGWYPQGPADLWRHRIQQLVATPGVVGINIHTGRLSEAPNMTPEQMFPRFKEGRVVYPFMGGVKWSPWHHLNIYTLYRLLKDPEQPARKIYEDWAAENYGKKAAKPLADLLLLSDDALYHGMLTFGVNLNNHSGFSIGGEGEKLIENIGRSIKYQLQLQPPLAPLFEINPDTVDRAIAEKRLSLQLIDTMIAILDDHRGDFAAADYRALREDLARMRSAMKGYMFSQAGYFAYRLATAEPPVVNRPYYVKLVKEMAEEAETLAVSKPEFLHQQTPRSFLSITRAFRDGLKAKGLW